ncbi:MAG TPA: MgtC/SapB family protein [Mariprofundaceae bacterium]|nr:MgtC/SapB family protein [Mariprofundaceae bacterium]
MLGQYIGDTDFPAIVALSVLCGAIIGLERQMRGKPAGIRTSIMVCLGTATFVHLGSQFAGPGVDPTRVLGQVITGIGFLGAGVMFAREGTVLGVTTAAVIWMLAGIGASIGLGQYHLGLGLAVTVVAVLFTCEWLEMTFAALTRGVHAIYHQTGRAKEKVDEEPPHNPS